MAAPSVEKTIGISDRPHVVTDWTFHGPRNYLLADLRKGLKSPVSHRGNRPVKTIIVGCGHAPWFEHVISLLVKNGLNEHGVDVVANAGTTFDLHQELAIGPRSTVLNGIDLYMTHGVEFIILYGHVVCGRYQREYIGSDVDQVEVNKSHLIANRDLLRERYKEQYPQAEIVAIYLEHPEDDPKSVVIKLL